MNPEKLRQVSPWIWLAIAAVAGLGVLTYHRYKRDDADVDWTYPKENWQAPAVVPFPAGSTSHTSCGDRACSHDSVGDFHGAFRGRAYAPSLLDSKVSFIGGIDL